MSNGLRYSNTVTIISLGKMLNVETMEKRASINRMEVAERLMFTFIRDFSKKMSIFYEEEGRKIK